MMQGDAYSVPVVIKAKDGTVITPEMATRVEITIGHLTRQWPGVITFNEDTLAWEFPLTQQQSFRLSQGKQKTQVRVAFSNGWVVGGDGTDVRVLKSKSKSILPAAAQQEKAANIAFGAIFAEIGAITVVLGAGLPEMSSATKGQYLTNDGETAEWANVDALPAMSSDTAGKMLTNDGEKAEWADVPRETMCVNFTEDTDGKWSADKNWDDVAALIENGGYVYAVDDIDVYPMTMYSPPEDGSQEPGVIRFSTTYTDRDDIMTCSLSLYSDGTAEYGEGTLQCVSYGEQQYLSADQQAQARKNIGAGTPYTLPIASPTQLGGVKPVAKTDAMTRSIGVDGNGGLYTEPSAWYVNITGTLNEPIGDKTPEEIYQAYTKGYAVYAVVQIANLLGGTPFALPLVSIVPVVGSYMVCFSASAEPHSPVDGIISITVTWNQKWYLFASELANRDDIPTIPQYLPNPNSLSITIGDNVVSYDGSEAKTVEVPENDNPLGITGAQVGQIAKITTVDTDGKPTKWEPADMANGGEVWEKLTFSIPENDPVSAATIDLPSTNIIKACIKISLFGTIEKTKFGVMVFTGATTGGQLLPADINGFYTADQPIRTGAIVLEKKADFWQSIYNPDAAMGDRNATGALRLVSYNSDYLYIKTSTANETFYGTIDVNYVVGGSI